MILSERKILKDSLVQWKVNVMRRNYFKSLQRKSLSKYLEHWKRYNKKNWKLSVRAHVVHKLSFLKKWYMLLLSRYSQCVLEHKVYKSFYLVKWRSFTITARRNKKMSNTFMMKRCMKRLQRIYNHKKNIQIQQKKIVFKKWYSKF